MGTHCSFSVPQIKTTSPPGSMLMFSVAMVGMYGKLRSKVDVDVEKQRCVS